MAAAVPITGTVQHYAWGDRDFIPRWLGVEPDGEPWAELWLGTHPSGPTTAFDGTPLGDLSGDLPYLVKVLAASEPLSLQVHPSNDQAVDGFRRGVYPDDRAKPELICALTPFDALCGIRPVEASLDLLDRIGAIALADAVRSEGVGAVIEGLYRCRLPFESTIDACADAEGIEAQLVRDLAVRYPGDPSVVVTLLMNRVHLERGEALHLTAGNLHAYLSGAGIELMGASDNVVRGGLTVKPVDVDELLRILDPTPLAEPVMAGAAATGLYPLPEAGCTLRRLDPGTAHTSTGHELALAMDGTTSYLPPGTELAPTVTTYVVTTP